jgi:hypothetical protein
MNYLAEADSTEDLQFLCGSEELRQPVLYGGFRPCVATHCLLSASQGRHPRGCIWSNERRVPPASAAGKARRRTQRQAPRGWLVTSRSSSPSGGCPQTSRPRCDTGSGTPDAPTPAARHRLLIRRAQRQRLDNFHRSTLAQAQDKGAAEARARLAARGPVRR